MIVSVDLLTLTPAPVHCRTINGRARYYYTYGDRVLVVCRDKPFDVYLGHKATAKFDTADSTIAADTLGLPDEWRNKKIIQCSLMPGGRAKKLVSLSEAIGRYL